MDTKTAEIQRKVGLLTCLIKIRNNEIEALTIGLDAIQSECQHEEAQVYRQQLIGQCPVCQKKFSTKLEVDAIYSE
jgi:hypothetical protein